MNRKAEEDKTQLLVEWHFIFTFRQLYSFYK